MPRIGVGLKEVNLVSRVVTLSSVDVEGLDLKAVRDKQEQIDLLGADQEAGGRAGARRPPRRPPRASRLPPRPPPLGPRALPLRHRRPRRPTPGYKITVEKVTLKGSATFTDESVSSPPTVLKIAA